MTEQNPFVSMAHSRKFWVFFITIVGGLITYFATKYLSPSQADDVIKIIGAIFAMTAWYMKMMKDEDVARLQNPPVVQTTTTNTNPISEKVTTVESKPDVVALP